MDCGASKLLVPPTSAGNCISRQATRRAQADSPKREAPCFGPKALRFNRGSPVSQRLERLLQAPLRRTRASIKYLGQYTHRVAISNQRLVAIDEHGVTFRTKSGKKATVDGVTFLTRWCKHVLPHGYVKIRHVGLMSSSHATTRLEVARALLEAQIQASNQSVVTPNAPIPVEKTLSRDAKWRDIILTLNGIDLGACSYCGGRNLVREPLSRGVAAARAPPQAAAA